MNEVHMMRLPPCLTGAYLHAVGSPFGGLNVWMENMSMTSSRVDRPAVEPAATVAPTTPVLAALALCMLLPSLGTSIANVALPTLVEAFGASFQQVQWVVLAYLLSHTALVVFAGRLGDVVGRRNMLIAGLATFTAASMLCGLAPSLWILVAARAVQGLGAALLSALAIALVVDVVPKKDAGKVMGLLGTTSAVGTALGPSLGGILVAAFGWPAIFFLKVPVGLLALHFVCRYLPSDRSASKGMGEGGRLSMGRRGWLAPLADPSVASGLAMTLVVAVVMMSTLVVGPFYLSHGLNLTTAAVGLAMSAGPIVSALAGMPAGRLVDRLGTRRATLWGLVGMLGACMALVVVPARWGLAGYVLPLVVLTTHYALFQAANNTAVMIGIGPDRRGAVSGMLSLARNLGLVLGAAASGSLFALLAGGGHPPMRADAAAMGFHATFLVAAGLLLVGVFTHLVCARAAAAR